jgi:hypothetical protein
MRHTKPAIAATYSNATSVIRVRACQNMSKE